MQLGKGRFIYVPKTGAVVVLAPSEDELVEMISAKSKGATEASARLFKALGVDGRTLVHMKPAEKKARLRELLSEHGERTAGRGKSKERAQPKAVKSVPISDLKHGNKQQERAAACKALLKKGLSQSEIAEHLNLSQGYVSALLKRSA